MKKLITTFLVLCFFCSLIFLGAYLYFNSFKRSKIHLATSEQTITINSGETLNQVIEQLNRDQIVENAFLLKLWVKLEPRLGKIKSGVYTLNENMTVAELMSLFSSDQGKTTQYKIQFIEGKRWQDYHDQLKKLELVNQVLVDNHEIEIAKQLGLEGSLEGWIAPETYFYTEKMTDLDILKKAYQSQLKNIQTIWADRALDLPYKNPYELLIMASIVEKETAIASERGKVASVFVNRLNKKMKLQTDPTIIYGLGDKYNGTIYRSQINDVNNPYNTYVIDGLPPTPIAMPSQASIYAAAHPEQTDYLYFVANGEGGHTFSSNYKAHQKAVEHYRQLLKNKNKQ